MKARLGELQQKLEYHEKNKGTSTDGDASGFAGRDDANRSPSVPLPTPAYTADNSPSPRPNEERIMFDDIHWNDYNNSPHALHTGTNQLFDPSPVTSPLTTPAPEGFTAQHSNITASGYALAAVNEYLRLQMQSFDTGHVGTNGQGNGYAHGVSAYGADPFCKFTNIPFYAVQSTDIYFQWFLAPLTSTHHSSLLMDLMR